MNECGTIIAGYHKGTNSFGFYYVMEIEDEDKTDNIPTETWMESGGCYDRPYTPTIDAGVGKWHSLVLEEHKMETIKVKQATKKGYIECPIGGVVDMAFPNQNTRRGRVQDNGQTVGALDTGSQHGLVEGKYRIRRLTPKECFRLQGWNFDNKDTYFERAEMVNSDSQLYKQAGNGVSVNVIQVIAESLAMEE